VKKLLLIVSVLMVFYPVLAVAQTNETQKACVQAKADAKREINGSLWLAGGCLIGLLAVGAAYLMEPSPPSSKLLNKSPEYVAAYTNCYVEEGRSIQTSNAVKGCLISVISQCGISLVVIIISIAGLPDID
jgi:hypothetical protein